MFYTPNSGKQQRRIKIPNQPINPHKLNQSNLSSSSFFFFFLEKVIYFGTKPALGLAAVLSLGSKCQNVQDFSFLRKSSCFLLSQMSQKIKGVSCSPFPSGAFWFDSPSPWVELEDTSNTIKCQISQRIYIMLFWLSTCFSTDQSSVLQKLLKC